MFFVNFLGDYWKNWPILSQLKHHNTHFNYADSIMPQFFFAVGFAFRLTFLKRLNTVGPWVATRQAIFRALGLMLLSVVLFSAFEPRSFGSWKELQQVGTARIISDYIKSDLWETLALIGGASLWILPVIGASVRTRVIYLIASALLHVAMAHWFNFHFVSGNTNLLDSVWPLSAGKSSFDGGPFGIVMWAMPMLVGSLAYDAVAANIRTALPKLLFWSIVMMSLGYGLSCGTMLFLKETTETHASKKGFAASPVIPQGATLEGRDWRSLLAEPPFHPPNPTPERLQNYWTMSKRQSTLSFMLFASGFALAVYALFLVLADWMRLKLGLFQTFGQNALAGYLTHEVVMKFVKPYVPSDSPHEWVAGGFVVFFAITWLFISSLERNRIYLKL